jgi:hypothetical protein
MSYTQRRIEDTEQLADARTRGILVMIAPRAVLKKDGKPTDFLRSKFTEVDRKKWIPWTTPELK